MEAKLANDLTLNKEYLPVLGLEACASAATAMLLGEDNPAIRDGRVSYTYIINVICLGLLLFRPTVVNELFLPMFLFFRVALR